MNLRKTIQTIIKLIVGLFFILIIIKSCILLSYVLCLSLDDGNDFDFDEKTKTICTRGNKFRRIFVSSEMTSYEINLIDGKQGSSEIQLLSTISDDYRIIDSDTLGCIKFEKNTFYKISNCSCGDRAPYDVYIKFEEEGKVFQCKYEDVKNIKFYR